MPINAPYKGKDFDPVPAGNHIARCYQILHIGTVPEEYEGRVNMMNKVRFTWELPNETKVFKEGEPAKPLSISKDYTLSMGDKANLRKVVEGWLGAGLHKEEAEFFDVETLIGQPCMLNVVHKKSKGGNLYADVLGVASIPKGMTAPEAINTSRVINYENFDQAVFDKLPDFLKDKMKKSEEYKRLTDPGSVSADEIPF